MPAPAAAKAALQGKPAAKPGAKSPMARALDKLGLRRDSDLVLHLPLRYEDETRLTSLAQAREASTVQIEATVASSEVRLHPRRQLLVVVHDGTQVCTLRFFNFYPSLQKLLAVGNTVRLRGELQGGFLGWTMVHPVVSAAGGPLPDALTPVYPASAQLPQAYLRKAIAGALARADLADTVPAELLPQTAGGPCWSLQQALRFLGGLPLAFKGQIRLFDGFNGLHLFQPAKRPGPVPDDTSLQGTRGVKAFPGYGRYIPEVCLDVRIQIRANHHRPLQPL